VSDGDPAPPTERGTAAPHFSANFALARSPISATAELLFGLLQQLVQYRINIIVPSDNCMSLAT